jgi:NADH:ubiquinone reductase (H+-translocating)
VKSAAMVELQNPRKSGRAGGELPHVVILGGGFGGLYAARELARAPVRITLVDRQNYHLFQPLLYQVATAALNPSDIAHPIRAALRRQPNARVLLAEIRSIDPDARRVHLDSGELLYDYLVVATGAKHSYFGNDRFRAHAPGLKTIEDALEVRRRVLLAYEAAEREADAGRRHAWLSFVVVGAGPTGVELAGALSEIGREVLHRDFASIGADDVRVVLVEGLEDPLPTYPPKLRRRTRESLERLGVEVMTGTLVSDIDDEGVTVGEARIPARTVLWAAGVRASPIGASLGAPLDRAGRVRVSPDLSVPERPEIFVVGDLISLAVAGEAVPGVAPAAIQSGRHAAANIRRLVAGEPARPFRYRDKGQLATIGRARAVAQLGRFQVGGFVAWVLWLVVHIYFLVGFRNRLFVVSQWAWSWLTFQRGARIITGDIAGELPPIEGPASRPEEQDCATRRAG